MATWKNQFFGLEPFEESQGGPISGSSTPPDATSDHADHGMDSTNTSPTKHGRKRSIFSRRSSKRASPMPEHSSARNSFGDRVKGADSESPLTYESTDTFNQSLSRSIIPDPLNELPAWFNKESEWASAPVHIFRSRYPIHNPIGPHCYRNQHLVPPPSKNRPSSVFSPSFPPMSAEAEHTEKPGWMPGPSRTPSGSPLPTPSSSQVRIDAAPKTRTRKLSNTPHDAVDLLDGSDPWGANWHHQSPYDINGSPTSAEGSEQQTSGRPRMVSFNGGQRHKTTIPSPLSQSTSAVHLQEREPEVEIAQLNRELAKRKMGVRSVFGGKSDEPQDAPAEAQSVPVYPLDPSPTTISSGSSQQKTLGKHTSMIGSSLPPSASQISITGSLSVPSIATSKKERRGSVLGRLVKRFSVMRKGKHRNSMTTTDEGPGPGSRQGSIEPEGRLSTSGPRNPSSEKTPLPSRRSTEASKRVPPPTLDPKLTPKAEVATTHPNADAEDRRSSVSLEAPFSVGRLTIANPDVPSLSDNSPVHAFTSLPMGAMSPASRVTYKLRDDKELHKTPSVIMNPSNGFSDSPVDIRSPEMVKNEAPSPFIPPKSPRHHSSERRLSSPPHPYSGTATWRSSSETRPSVVSLRSMTRRSLDHQPSSRHSRQASTDARTSSEVPKPSTLSSAHRQTSPQPLQNLSPTSPPNVPFPTSHVAVPSFVQAVVHSDMIDDSPLSKASLLVNPPTPHVPSAYISAAATMVPSPAITPSPSGVSVNSTGTHTSRDLSPTQRDSSTRIKSSSSVKSRETETFRLVRSPSTGYVHRTADTIVVHGEQWQVVTETPKKSKTAKEGSRQKLFRKESKRQEKESKRQEKEREAAARGHARATSMDSVMGRPLSKGRESTKKRKEHQGNAHSNSVDPAAGKASANGGAQLERHPSTSTRPTSEITDLNAMRAKEVWEMDRLWKGRSMAYGLEGPQVVYAQTIGSSPSIPGDVYSSRTMDTGGHGSSHTSYKLQTPFHGHPDSHTHIPASSTYVSLPQSDTYAPASSHPYLYPNGLRSYPDISTIPSMSSPESSPPTNPLPPPPRRSSYRIPPLPPSLSREDNASVDYWHSFAGVVAPSR